MLDSMLPCYRMIRENNISVIYNGPVWVDGMEGIGKTLRKRLELDELPLSTSQSVFSIFMEQMYNVLHYSADRGTVCSEDTGEEIPVSYGVFVLGTKDKQYFIQCANKIEPGQIPHLKKRIDFLNSLDKPGLRQHYKERIRADNDNPYSKGAGIGLIEIARRANSKIEYAFLPLEDGCSLFTLYVTVG